MSIQNYLYKVYFGLVSLPFAAGLYIVGWKASVIRSNTALCSLPHPWLRFRLYQHAARDLMRLFFGRLEIPIRIRPQDAAKLKILKSSPSLFLTAHFHNWELMGSWMTRQGVPLLSGAKPMAWVPAQSLLDRMRRRLSMKVIYRDIPRSAARHLSAGGCFGFLWDQRVPHSETSTPFFGHTVAVDPLPLFLLRRQSVPVHFGALLPNGTFRVISLLDTTRPRSPERGGRSPERIANSQDRVARRYHRVLEVLVRRHPSYWYGLAHRRFRDAIPARPDSGVSRETLAAPGLMVSRETKLSA